MSERVPDLRITQIAVSSAAGQPDVLYALGNDGSIWRLVIKLGHANWFQLPPLISAEPMPAYQPTSAPI